MSGGDHVSLTSNSHDSDSLTAKWSVQLSSEETGRSELDNNRSQVIKNWLKWCFKKFVITMQNLHVELTIWLQCAIYSTDSTPLYHNIKLTYTSLECTTPHRTALHCTIPHHSKLYHTTNYNILHCVILRWGNEVTPRCTVISTAHLPIERFVAQSYPSGLIVVTTLPPVWIRNFQHLSMIRVL